MMGNLTVGAGRVNFDPTAKSYMILKISRDPNVYAADVIWQDVWLLLLGGMMGGHRLLTECEAQVWN